MDDREVVAAIAAEDPAGIAVAYDRYADVLYGYCHSMLRQPAEAADALRDTFVMIAAAPADLPEAPELRPWLYSVARKECLRRLRTKPTADGQEADATQQADMVQRDVAGSEPIDATMPLRAVSQPIATAHEPIDATMAIRAVSQPTATAHEPIDATIPIRAVSQLADVADRPASADHDLEQAELQTLIRAVMAELKPREREVIELQLRHDLYDADLAVALGLSWSRAHVLAERARGQLEGTLGAMLVARTGRAACPALDELLANWDGQLTHETRELVGGHTGQCETCAGHRLGALRPAALCGLLPLTPLPTELRERVLRACSSTSPEARAYRRRVVRRAEWTWLTRFSAAIRLVTWSSIRGRRPATTTLVFVAWVAAVWVIAAVLFIFAGSHPDGALAARPTVNAPTSSPATAPTTAAASPTTAPASPTAKPSSAVSHTPVVVPPPVEASDSPTPSARPSPSRSPKPSRSPSAKPSKSPSPKPSGSPTPSPTPSTSATS